VKNSGMSKAEPESESEQEESDYHHQQEINQREIDNVCKVCPSKLTV
jgi:U3 small nucleolar RNA-associated protein 14